MLLVWLTVARTSFLFLRNASFTINLQGLKTEGTWYNSKTPIYRGFWGKGYNRGKSGFC